MVYEDDLAYAFRDIAPVAPTHVLVIPKVKDGLSQLSKVCQRFLCDASVRFAVCETLMSSEVRGASCASAAAAMRWLRLAGEV